MSLLRLLVRDVTVITAGARTDAYGDSQPDWTVAAEQTVPGWLAQQSSSENRDGRNGTTAGLSVTVPAGTPLSARDRVRVDGVTYEVIAQPVSAWTPRGEHHIEAAVEVVVG